MKKNLKGTWKSAFLNFSVPIMAIYLVRWLVIEPFVIPSGSMIPTLLVHDHIVVNKLAYGIHLPFSKKWIINWSEPKRGDIAVFRFPINEEVFYVKRIMGLPGETVEMKSGILYVNGSAIVQVAQESSQNVEDEKFQYFQEDQHLVRYLDKEATSYGPTTIPENHYLALGDNRNQSSDSRIWGFVPQENLVGRATQIWLSCTEMLSSPKFLCNPSTLRMDRILKHLN